MKMRVLIVDDEPLARFGIVTRLHNHSNIEIVGECGDSREAAAAIKDLHPDLVFLDIQMPGMSGLELLPTVSGERMPSFVFVTAFEEHALQAFAVEALDYLLKPIDNLRFRACLDRAFRLFHLKRQQDLHSRLDSVLNEPFSRVQYLTRLPIRSGPHVSFLPLASVDWIEGMGDYVGLHAGTKTHLIRESLFRLEQRLDPQHFLRIHRSAIVRVERITRIDPMANRDANLTMWDGTEIRVSRRYASALKGMLRYPLP